MPVVTFCPPPHDEVPLILSGTGLVEWSSQGMLLRGSPFSKWVDFASGCFGIVIGLAFGAWVFIEIGAKHADFGEVFVFIGLALGLGAGRALMRSGRKTIRVPWERVKDLRLEGECVSLFLLEPKGPVWFVPGRRAAGVLAGAEPSVTAAASKKVIDEICQAAARAGADPRASSGIRPQREFTRAI